MGSIVTRLLQHYRRLEDSCDIRVSTKVNTCARRCDGLMCGGRPRERFMKIVRACLLLLALCPAWSFALEPGPEDNPYVEGIQCNGNVATSCELIRTQTGITVGKALDEIQVENARLRLETLPNFRTVRIHLIKGSHKHWVIVVIDVTETDPVTTAFAAGTLTQLANRSAVIEALAARVTDHDLFGSGKALDLSVVVARPVEGGGGQEYAGRLQYSDPRLFDSRRFFFTAGAFYTQSEFLFSAASSLFAGMGIIAAPGQGVISRSACISTRIRTRPSGIATCRTRP